MTRRTRRGHVAIDLLHTARLILTPHHWPRPPADAGRPVLLIPGFLAGDHSLDHMAAWLRTGGLVTERAGMNLNVDCMEPIVETIEQRLEVLVERTGRKAIVIGHSRGGTLGRVVAVRRPELVDTLITLGTPALDQLAFKYRVLRIGTYLIGAVGSAGVPGIVTYSCLRGPCCARSRADNESRVPDSVRHVAVYSRRDGIVDWQACLDPHAELVEVPSYHLLMSMNPAIWRAIAQTCDEQRQATTNLLPPPSQPGAGYTAH